MNTTRSAVPRRRTSFLAALAVAGSLVILYPATVLGASSPRGTISGVVTADGKPSRGATIVIEAMPRLDQAATARAGIPIDMRVVGKARADSRGRFAVTPTGIPAAYIDRFGAVNLTATVSNGRKMVRWTFPLKAAGSTSRLSAATTAKSSARKSVALRFDLGSHPGAADAADLPSSWVGPRAGITSDGLLALAAEPVTSSADPASVSPNIGVCYFYWTSNYKYAVPEAYANVWSWTGAKVTAHEDQSTSHSVGVAAKNTSGVWSQNGEVSFGESGGSSIDSPGLWDNQVNNEINYRQQKNTCSGSAEWWYPVSTYALNYPVLGWAHSLHPIWSSCVTYGAGNTPTKTQGTNVKYSAGVGFGPISLSAQAGWSTDISIKFNMTSTSKLCGSTASGWVSSPQAEAHQ